MGNEQLMNQAMGVGDSVGMLSGEIANAVSVDVGEEEWAEDEQRLMEDEMEMEQAAQQDGYY
tara:strand:- start:278 stop:463 length:186 start_codon:yes stop_codon:yes gene_type:complete